MQDLPPKLLALGIVMVLFALGFLPERDERKGVPLGDVLLDESVPRNSAAPEADENDRQVRVRYAALVSEGDTLAGNRDFDKAIAGYSEAIRLIPTSALAFNGRGLAYANKGDNDQAIADYSEAIRLDPTNAVALQNRALAYGNKRQYDQAIADYSEAIRLDPQYAMAFCNRGRAKQAKGDRTNGGADVNRAKQLRPSSCQ